MGLRKGEKSIDLVILKTALKKIDSNLSDVKAFSIARFIMRNKEFTETDKILTDLGFNVDEISDTAYNQIWIESMMQRFA